MTVHEFLVIFYIRIQSINTKVNADRLSGMNGLIYGTQSISCKLCY